VVAAGVFPIAGHVVSQDTTDAPVQKMQLHQAIKYIYFLSNLVGMVLRYLGLSVGEVHEVVHSMGWPTRWGITLPHLFEMLFVS
jgi:hypothetical protein